MNRLSIPFSFLLIYLVTGCGSSSDVGPPSDSDDDSPAELVSVSGKVSDLSGNGVAGVVVAGVYTSPDDQSNPSATSDTDGDFSLQVLKDNAVSLRATKDSFAPMNSARAPLSADLTDAEIVLPTMAEAQSMIDTAFGAGTTPIQNKAWLIVEVTDADGDEVNGQAISSSIPAGDEVYTNCDGSDSGDTVTTGAPCPGERASVMYIAYYDAAGAADISVAFETQVAPLRMGEITALEFEIVPGSFDAGKAIYDAECASCHKAGSYDPTGSASDIYDDGEMVVPNLNSILGMEKVPSITPQEALDLRVFLEDPSIM